MELEHGLISVDDHVQEHPEVWTSRLARATWGDRIPHIAPQPDGTDRWTVDGRVLPLSGVAAAGALLPDRTHEPQRWDDVPKAAYSPRDRLGAMDADGVDYSVLYPTVAGIAGEAFGQISDPALELACVRAYNDWLIDEWTSTSPRFIPQCIVPLWPIEATVAEIRRSIGRGHRGVIYPSVPMEMRDVPHINEPDYDPIWSVCEELEVPICFHAGGSLKTQIPPYEGWSTTLSEAFQALTRPASSAAVMVNFLISRILMRHPLLKVVFAESALGWVTYQLEWIDRQADEDGLRNEGYDLTPSEMFRRHCYVTGWYDRSGLATRRFIGTENILWSTNFPLATSTWPRSHSTIDACFQEVSEAERNLILWRNAAELYKL